MLQLQFSDRMVSYETFINDIASKVVEMVNRNDPEMISQRHAYRIFGRGNVDRWKRKGLLTPCKRPGKVEYSTAQLRHLQARTQDYF